MDSIIEAEDHTMLSAPSLTDLLDRWIQTRDQTGAICCDHARERGDLPGKPRASIVTLASRYNEAAHLFLHGPVMQQVYLLHTHRFSLCNQTPDDCGGILGFVPDVNFFGLKTWLVSNVVVEPVSDITRLIAKFQPLAGYASVIHEILAFDTEAALVEIEHRVKAQPDAVPEGFHRW